MRTSIVLLALVSAVSQAQDVHQQCLNCPVTVDERVVKLTQNSESRRITLKTDRDQYLAGEIIELSVRVENPLSTAIEVFDIESNYFAGSMLRENGGSFRTHDGSRPDARTPTTWMLPTEVKEYRILSTDALALGKGKRTFLGNFTFPYFSAPVKTGRYGIGINYPGRRSPAMFDVVAPALVEMIRLFLDEFETETDARTGAEIRYQKSAYAYVFATHGRYYVGMTEALGWSAKDIRTSPELPLTPGQVSTITFFSRLAESSEPMGGLSLKSTGSDRIEVRWQEPGKQPRLLRVDHKGQPARE